MIGICLKIPYTLGEARLAARRTGGQRPYKCPYCSHYHLSIMSKRDVKQARKRNRVVKAHRPKPGLIHREDLL